MQTGYPRGNFIVFRMVYVMVFFYAFVLVFYVRSTKFLLHIFVILQAICPTRQHTCIIRTLNTEYVRS